MTNSTSGSALTWPMCVIEFAANATRRPPIYATATAYIEYDSHLCAVQDQVTWAVVSKKPTDREIRCTYKLRYASVQQIHGQVCGTNFHDAGGCKQLEGLLHSP